MSLYDLLRRWQRDKLLIARHEVSEHSMAAYGKEPKFLEHVHEALGRILGDHVRRMPGAIKTYLREQDRVFEFHLEAYVLTKAEFEELVTAALGNAQMGAAAQAPGSESWMEEAARKRNAVLDDVLMRKQDYDPMPGFTQSNTKPKPPAIDRQALLKRSTGKDIV